MGKIEIEYEDREYDNTDKCMRDRYEMEKKGYHIRSIEYRGDKIYVQYFRCKRG